nr:energy transducer TonB [Sphingobium sp. AS12]
MEAQRNAWQGTAGFRLTISSSGEVEQCIVTASSGHAVLDEATCRLLSKRARFKPARNASGTAIPDSYNGRITWRMPS